jgi:hypothetical protein
LYIPREHASEAQKTLAGVSSLIGMIRDRSVSVKRKIAKNLRFFAIFHMGRKAPAKCGLALRLRSGCDWPYERAMLF